MAGARYVRAMAWSVTLNPEGIEREREAVRRARSEAEAKMAREIEAVHAKYADWFRAFDEELADLDHLERTAIKLAGAAATVPPAHGVPAQAVEPPPTPGSSQYIAHLSLAGQIGADTPSQKAMVLDAVRHHRETGVARPEIIDFVKAKYGAEISPGNVTTGLYRLKADDGLVRNAGRLWFPASPDAAAPAEAATPNAEKGGW